jgi:hypothetical protein
MEDYFLLWETRMVSHVAQALQEKLVTAPTDVEIFDLPDWVIAKEGQLLHAPPQSLLHPLRGFSDVL